MNNTIVRMILLSTICAAIVAVLMYLLVYPVLLGWGLFQAAMNSLWIPPIATFVGIFFLYFQIDLWLHEKKKKSKLTGIMIAIPYTIWLKTKNQEITREKKFDKGVSEIDLSSKRIRSIDFDVLRQFKNLEHLDLSNNDIHQINLKPLEWCDELLGIYLTRNKLSRIDLDPLGNCTKLQSLYLADNELDVIDLWPLLQCTRLVELHLQENNLQNLDFEPLSSCTQLVNLYTNDNPLQLLDITPLRTCMSFDVIDFGDAKLVTTIGLDEGKWPQALKQLSGQIEERY